MSSSPDVIAQVWAKAQYVSQEAESKGFRMDSCGAWMHRWQHGNRDSKYGWEIHHVIPKARGGSDQISNLIPLQWENNAATGDGPLSCVVKAR